MRTVDPRRPERVGVHDGLSYALWRPRDAAPRGGVVILHGADSRKERHFGFARACHASGFAALAFDARGHGDSPGRLDGRALDDVAVMAELLREVVAPAPIALRGASMGGYLAICGAALAGADAIVAICPAPGVLLQAGLTAGRFDFPADAATLEPLLLAHDLRAAANALPVPLMLLHATGDDRVDVQHSRDLAATATDVRFVEVRGGHHGSIQHDAELTGESLRWLDQRLPPA